MAINGHGPIHRQGHGQEGHRQGPWSQDKAEAKSQCQRYSKGDDATPRPNAVAQTRAVAKAAKGFRHEPWLAAEAKVMGIRRS